MKYLILILLSTTDLYAQDLKLPNYKLGRNLEFWSYPLFAFSGFAGGMGERFLSKDGNWDTRSKRSHVWRDISIYTTAGASSMFTAGIVIQDSYTWKDLLKILGAGGFYYAGTRIGYNTGQFIK